MKKLAEFLCALRFLTTFPLGKPGKWDKGEFSRSILWYPVVGILIGLTVATAYGLLNLLFPSSLCALLAVAGWTIVTGGLHLDGVSDCADGFFYAGTQEARLKIMKDVHHGTYGLLALFFTLMLKAAAISSLTVKQAFYVLPLAAALGRLGVLIQLRLPLLSNNGLAASLKSALPRHAFLKAAIIPVILALVGLLTGIILFLVAAVSWYLIGKFALKHVGGVNGDVLGLTIEWTELLILLAFSAMTSFVGAP